METKKQITYDEIRHNEEVLTYIKRADMSLEAMGFTEHNVAHVTKTAQIAGDILQQLDYSEHDVELARIAGFMHDIGNVVNRIDHAQSGAIMAFRILDKLGMPSEDVALVISAIGNHDESTAWPVNAVAAALILADKSDVRRSRVRPGDNDTTSIHYRVNYAVTKKRTHLDKDKMVFTLQLDIDTEISPVIDYFEIFMQRMTLCRMAAKYLGLRFRLVINHAELC